MASVPFKFENLDIFPVYMCRSDAAIPHLIASLVAKAACPELEDLLRVFAGETSWLALLLAQRTPAFLFRVAALLGRDFGWDHTQQVSLCVRFFSRWSELAGSHSDFFRLDALAGDEAEAAPLLQNLESEILLYLELVGLKHDDAGVGRLCVHLYREAQAEALANKHPLLTIEWVFGFLAGLGSVKGLALAYGAFRRQEVDPTRLQNLVYGFFRWETDQPFLGKKLADFLNHIIKETWACPNIRELGVLTRGVKPSTDQLAQCLSTLVGQYDWRPQDVSELLNEHELTEDLQVTIRLKAGLPPEESLNLEEPLLPEACWSPRVTGRELSRVPSMDLAEPRWVESGSPPLRANGLPRTASTYSVRPQRRDSKKILRRFYCVCVQISPDTLDVELPNMSYAQFQHQLLTILQLNLSKAELVRVWNDFHKRSTLSMTFKEFEMNAGISPVHQTEEEGTFASHAQLLDMAAVSTCARSTEFQVPDTYDIRLPTDINYLQEKPYTYVGEFAEARRKLDPEVHGAYAPVRQLWQDAVIRKIAVLTDPQPYPWLICTCGMPGAGKTYTMSWMSSRGYFPLENIAHIDADYFKLIMPEWALYTQNEEGQQDIDEYCGREANFMCALAEEVALEHRQNLWRDCTLVDGSFFRQHFHQIKELYPEYRVAVFFVMSSKERARERIRDRAAITRRGVSDHFLNYVEDNLSDALNSIIGEVDFLARIKNNVDHDPILESFETVDHSRNWEVVQDRFARHFGTIFEFPHCLAPFYLLSTQVNVDHILEYLMGDQNSVFKNEEMTINLLDYSFDDHNLLLHLSRAAPLTLDRGSQKLALMDKAAFFSYVHPVQTIVHRTPASSYQYPDLDIQESSMFSQAHRHTFGSGSSPSHSSLWGPRGTHQNQRRSSTFSEFSSDNRESRESLSFSPTHSRLSLGNESEQTVDDYLSILQRNGGFAYFDESANLIDVVAISSVRTPHMIQFGNWVALDEEVSQELSVQKRLSKPSRFYQSRNVKWVSWILPRERIGQTTFGKHGGLAFMFDKSCKYTPPDRYFPVMSAH